MFPKQLGRFDIKNQLGDSERGTLFHAYDPHLQREVAVKLLKSQNLYTITSERIFKEQAELIRNLNHPAILPVYDYGAESGRPFIVMPLMPGGSLLDQIKRHGSLSLARVVEIFTPLAEALDYAAARNILHLDLKPNNILFDQHGHPFLADFGLVQLIDALTVTRPPMANAAYISPEQVRGYQMDGRLHVYSLATIIFEALTGQPLFSGASEMVTSFKHISENPRAPRTLRPDLPEGVDAVLLKALEKKVEDRYPTTREFLRMLELAQGGAISPEVLVQQRGEQNYGWEMRASGVPAPTASDAPPTGWTFERKGSHTPTTNPASAVALVLLISVSLCALIGGLGAVAFLAAAPSSTEFNVTQVSETLSRQAEAVRISALNWPVVMADPFDDNRHAWIEDEVEDDAYAAMVWNIQNGQYLWQAAALQGFVWRVWPDITPVEDFYAAVDAQRISGSSTAQYGLIFRNSDEFTTYYYFEVRESQEFSIYYFTGSEWLTLMSPTFSPSIRPGQVNRLEVIGRGDQFTFFINERFVVELFEPTLVSGEVGLAIGLSNQGDEAEIVFDNFEVRSPVE